MTGSLPGELSKIRRGAGSHQTVGFDDSVLTSFWETDPNLRRAVTEAVDRHARLCDDHPELAGMDEQELCSWLQKDVLSFYGEEASSPYVPLAAAGPWVVTTHGAVLHDSAGYGMLGMGHGPRPVIDSMQVPWVMANVMTPSLSQLRFTTRLNKEIGRTRNGCPFGRFMFLNSGSEAVSLAGRIADLNAFRMTSPGSAHAGRKVRVLSLKGSFHGRTERAARASDSTRQIYAQNLASFRDSDPLDVVDVNDSTGLQAAFDDADRNGVFYEALFLEPVLGEGEPGVAITPEFYDLARKLTSQQGALLIVDSIQAGLRAHGTLSIVDYPGFRELAAPDIETYSKALNAGQYPLSVIALAPGVDRLYRRGIYGNTMTANPRALEVGCAVLDSVTEDLRRNICMRGVELLERLGQIADQHPEALVRVQGTGLIVCAEMNPETHPVRGHDGLEQRLRSRGVALIHAGENGLRFTPHFAITSAEIDLLVATVREALSEYEPVRI